MKNIRKIIAGIAVLTMLFGLIPGSGVRAEGKTVTVSTQKELNAALNDASITGIKIETKKKAAFTLMSGDHSKVGISINAPKATVKNKGTFKKITIDDAKKFTEYSTGNSIVVNDGLLTLATDKKASVKALALNSGSGKVTVKNSGTVSSVAVNGSASVVLTQNGKMGKVTVTAPASVEIGGKSKSKLSVAIKETADGASIESSLPVKAAVYGDVALLLKKGAEKSGVTLKTGDAGVSFENRTAKTVTVTGADGKKKKVKAGKELVSENYEPKGTEEADPSSNGQNPEATPEPSPSPTPGANDPAGGDGTGSGDGGSTSGGSETDPAPTSAEPAPAPEITVKNWAEFKEALKVDNAVITIAGRVVTSGQGDVACVVSADKTIKFAKSGELVLAEHSIAIEGTIITSEAANEIVLEGNWGNIYLWALGNGCGGKWIRGRVTFEAVCHGQELSSSVYQLDSSGINLFLVNDELNISDCDGVLDTIGVEFVSSSGGKVFLNGTEYSIGFDGKLTTARSAGDNLAWDLRHAKAGDVITVSDDIEVSGFTWFEVHSGITLKIVSGGKITFKDYGGFDPIEGTLDTSSGGKICFTGNGRIRLYGGILVTSADGNDISGGGNVDLYFSSSNESPARWKYGDVTLSVSDQSYDSSQYNFSNKCLKFSNTLEILGTLEKLDALGITFYPGKNGKVFLNGVECNVDLLGKLVTEVNNNTSVTVTNRTELENALKRVEDQGGGNIVINGEITFDDNVGHIYVKPGITLSFAGNGRVKFVNYGVIHVYGTMETSTELSEIVSKSCSIVLLSGKDKNQKEYQGMWNRGNVIFYTDATGTDGKEKNIEFEGMKGIALSDGDRLDILGSLADINALRIEIELSSGGKIFVNGAECNLTASGELVLAE